MASHQIERVRVGTLHEPSSINVPRNRINMPSSQAPSIERNTESRSIPRQEDRPSIRPISKTSRSLSSDDAVRPSGLPRFAGNSSSYRRPSVPTIPTARPDPPQHASVAPKAKARDTIVTPLDRSNRINDRPRNVLRRKANFKRQEQTDRVASEGQIKDVGTEDVQTTKSPLSSHTHHEDDANVPAQDVIPQSNSSINSTKSPKKTTTLPTENTQTRQIPKELMGLRTVINTTNLPPPPTPIFPSASTPSTRYSGSPGMWSSRGSTPTSLSSYSPGITQPANYRFKQQSPIHRRQALGLQTVTTPVSQIDPDEPTMLGPIATDHYAKNVGVEINQTRNTEEIRVPIGGPSPEQINPPQNISTQSVDSDSQTGKANLLASPYVGTNASARPRRPSRDGTEQLEQSVSPVIRSNLPALRANISHVRRKSADKAQSPELLRVVPPRSAATSVESLQSNVSNRIPPRNDVATQLPRKAQRTLVKAPKESKVYNSTNTANKFSLFGKKSKVDLAPASSDTADLSSRKGPAAGTGHEGYGRYAHRGRKPSVSSSGSRARSTSTSGGASVNSNKGVNRQDTTIDDFLRDRLEPVIINGGGLAREELFRTQSGQSLSTLSVTSVSSSSMVAGGRPVGDWSSESLNSSLEPKKQTGKKFSSETSLPSLVSSDQRIKPKMMRNETAPAQIPTLESRKRFSTTPAASRTSEDSSFSALPVISKTTSKSESIGSTGASKSKTSRRWNFFHRSQKKETKEEIHLPTKETVPETQLHAEVASISRARPIAHYALLDADSDTLEDILHRVEESPPSDNESISQNRQNKSDLALNARHGTSVLLPSPPAILKEFQSEVPSPPRNRPASPKVYFQKEINNPRQEGKRKSRLEPVGRIPRVVSRRERDHRPSPQSYSRPFCRDEAPSLTITAGPPTALKDLESDQSKLYLQMDPFQQGPFYKVPGASGAPSALVSSESANFMSVAYSTNEFLRFSPRKPSEASTSTSEGDSILATVAAMGLKPQTGLEEEDIWAEYDDLLDTMLAPKQAPQPKTISSFELAKKASKTLQAEISASNLTQRVSTASDTPSLAATDAKSPDQPSDASTRLRRSKISAALHSSVSPSPQVSYSELIAGYSERNKSLSDFIPPDSPAKPQEEQVQTQKEELQLLTPANTPDFETTRRRNTILFDMAERMREGAAAQTNLRSASLMTSRWLSFGRVLFSPAHNRIQKSESECILILDGLGNDDWSYYCALTYPGAHIYNLSIRSGSSSSSPHPDAWKPPSNHHHVHHIGNQTAFPFPKGFFSVCVLRFPAASSEDRQRHILSECKRVLRPGGYLETSILDLDLVNVGSRTRKAVRSLKEKIYQADPDISLKPASDNIQRLLGICGYDNLNRCMVSIPVAGMIGGSTASSSSTNTLSDLPSADTGTSPQPSLTASSLQPHAQTPSDDTEPSLGDLLSDPSPSATNDQSITKVVAKVGRWWYTRCYEIPVLSDPSTDKSIWSEQRILRECQKRGTGFRLLIAYAQKPSEKRRTVSF